MTESLIIRTNSRENFTVIPNEMANDTRIGADALGLLVYLITKPNDWKVRINELRNRFDMGKDKTYRILATLEQYGYVTRESVREEGKFAETRYIVRDVPCPDFSEPVKPEPSQPDAKNPPLTKKRLNKEIKNTKSTKKGKPVSDLELDEGLRQYALDLGLDPDDVLEAIRLWNETQVKKKLYASLSAFWKSWCRRESKRAPRASNRQQSQSKPKAVTLTPKQQEFAKMKADKLYARHAHEYYDYKDLLKACENYLGSSNSGDEVWQEQGTGLENPF